jgi:cell wall-associated NlpC family hydrolase
MSRYRRRRDRRDAALAVAGGLILAVMAHAGGALGAHVPAGRAPSAAAAQAVAYARAQLGKPYAWGGTGPDGYDCSGLVMQAYAAAGVSIPRTSQEQWAAGPQVSAPARGDLVFFAGGDGTPSAPGHVGIVVDPARNLMIDAYGPDGAPISYDTYGLPTSRPGNGAVVGFTDPVGSS